MPKHDERLMIRLPKSVHAALVQITSASRRTINGEIAFLIENLVITATADRGSPEFVQAANGLRAALMPIMPTDKKQEDVSGLGAALVAALHAEPTPPAPAAPRNGTGVANHVANGTP